MMKSSTLKLFLTLLCLLGAIPRQADAQIIFSEDFDGIGGPTAGGAGTYTFPSGWLLRNVDNRTPAGTVSYVNEAWERREDFANNVADSAAFSTSWYSPAGAANDWMWTPLIGPITVNTVLNWNAITYDPLYPDGYEVRVMTQASGPPTGGTAVIGNQITNSTTIFTIPAENTTWTARTQSLAAYAGQSIYIGYRNTSNDEFLLLIDDVVVQNIVAFDARMTAVDSLEYTLIPEDHQDPSTFNASLLNVGTSALTNVFVEVVVRDGGGGVAYTANSATLATLASGASANFSIPGTTSLTPDIYTVEYIAHHSQTDGTPADDTLFNAFIITSGLYARDNGNVTGGLGIGAGNGGYLGQEFTLYQTDLLDTIEAFVTQGYTGEPLAAVIWSMVNDTPSAIIASTDTLIYPDDSARLYFLPIANGGEILGAGTYAVTFVEFDSTMQLGQSMEIFTPRDMWVDWPTSPLGGWANIEAFGTGFQRAQVLRLEVACNDLRIDSVSAQPATCGLNNGSVTAHIGGGPSQRATYSWSNGGTTQTITGLAPGVYRVTVSYPAACSFVDSARVDTSASASAAVSVTQPACFGDLGTAAVTSVGGTAPFTYLWSNGGTTASINVGPGSYTVTVTDALGCTGSAGPVTINNAPAALTSSTSSTDETAPGANDGTATVTAGGGTPGYTYLWSNGGTTATISGLAGGTYTVTVTDANGCDIIDTVVVTTIPIGVDNSLGGLSIGISPNPSNGQFEVNVGVKAITDIAITVIDPQGKVVMEDFVPQTTAYVRTISLQDAADGIYLVQVRAGEVVKVEKVVVRN